MYPKFLKMFVQCIKSFVKVAAKLSYDWLEADTFPLPTCIKIENSHMSNLK